MLSEYGKRYFGDDNGDEPSSTYAAISPAPEADPESIGGQLTHAEPVFVDGVELLADIERFAGRFLAFPTRTSSCGAVPLDRPHMVCQRVLRDPETCARLTRAGQRKDPRARGSGAAVPRRTPHPVNDHGGALSANRCSRRRTTDRAPRRGRRRVRPHHHPPGRGSARTVQRRIQARRHGRPLRGRRQKI